MSADHLGEADLVLVYYAARGDGGEPVDVRRHLESCAACREALADLERELDALEIPEPPERDEGYGRRVWAELEPKLPERAGARRGGGFDAASAWWLLAAAAVLAATFLAGRLTGPAASPESQEALTERILLVALGDHLSRSQMLLLDVTHPRGTEDPAAIAEDLLRESRLYRQSAQGVLDASTVEALDELERVLLDVVHGTGSEEELSARIEEQDLLFKIRILQTSVRQREEALQARRF